MMSHRPVTNTNSAETEDHIADDEAETTVTTVSVHERNRLWRAQPRGPAAGRSLGFRWQRPMMSSASVSIGHRQRSTIASRRLARFTTTR